MMPRDKEATRTERLVPLPPPPECPFRPGSATRPLYTADRAIPRVSECQSAPAVRSLGRYRLCMRRLHIDGSTGLAGVSRNVTRAPIRERTVPPARQSRLFGVAARAADGSSCGRKSAVHRRSLQDILAVSAEDGGLAGGAGCGAAGRSSARTGPARQRSPGHHAGAGLRVSNNASVRALREVISRVVDEHGYRAGARRMAAALAAERED